MTTYPQPLPWAKPILAILGPELNPEDGLLRRLEKSFGLIEFKGQPLLFDSTDYYRDEFGSGLFRFFVTFRGLMDSGRLIDYKHVCASIEKEWRRDGKRTYNLDAGFLDPDKLVLASFKRGPSKVYLGDGVYADMLLKYAKGRFVPFPWAFADFKDGRYDKALLVIREKLKSDLRKKIC